MLTLGIETSCDETGLALMEDGRVVCSKLASQEDLHAVFGGVVPELASREHLRILPGLFDDLLLESGRTPGELDAIAVARGPGLLGSLLVGLGFAKGLALSTGAGLIGVNHLWAHLLAPGLEQELLFPALGLLVSGGHTQLTLMHRPDSLETVGRTLDDAAGEAFDKVAKLLNLPYPGGRHIDQLAKLSEPDTALFPRPYLKNRTLDFSFSGLKTAVATHVAANPGLRFPSMVDKERVLEEGARNRELCRVCSSFNWAVASTLQIKTRRALGRYPQVTALIVAGGVAANSMVRRLMAELAAEAGLRLLIPSPGLCTDNGSMVAYCGEVMYQRGWSHDLGVDAVPRGRPVPMDFTPRRRAFQAGPQPSG